MFLVSATIERFKSITTPQTVAIGDEVTVLVGMNEAGKTVFLKALEKSHDAQGLASFSPVSDYPRKEYSKYQKQHDDDPATATATKLTYRLTENERNSLNKELHTELPAEFTFSVTHLYNNTIQIGINVSEQPVLDSLFAKSKLSTDVKTALKDVNSIRSIPDLLNDISLTAEDEKFLEVINNRIKKPLGAQSYRRRSGNG